MCSGSDLWERVGRVRLRRTAIATDLANRERVRRSDTHIAERDDVQPIPCSPDLRLKNGPPHDRGGPFFRRRSDRSQGEALVALRGSGSSLASLGRGNRSRRHPWRLDCAPRSLNRAQHRAISLRLRPAPIVCEEPSLRMALRFCRRRSESDRLMKVLQTSPFPLGYGAIRDSEYSQCEATMARAAGRAREKGREMPRAASRGPILREGYLFAGFGAALPADSRP